MGFNLFIKIFLGFWLLCCAILGTWMLASNYFAEQPAAQFSHADRPPGPPHRFVLRSLYQLQHEPQEELRETMQRMKERHGVDIFLLGDNASDLFGREPPPAAKEIAARLDGRRRRVREHHPEGVYIAHTIYRQDVGPLAAVFHIPPPAGALDLLGSYLWLRIALAVLVSGIVCYGLSRLMTSRLKALQRASRQLAQGELDTRLKVRDRGGDETDELARDFNTMAAQLQERIQAQRRLLGDISHELRSPLARLRIALALAQQDPDNRDQHFQRLEQEAERLEELIAQLLSSNAGSVALDTHIDLVPLLRQLCADTDFEGHPASKSVTLTTPLEQALVLSSGDLLRKCFENLLRNALTHTAEGTAVTVALEQIGDEYVVRVSDCGPGVPEGELDSIFGAFYRVDTARSRESGGYGLGLSIARRAVQQHGGAISARNTGAGLEVTTHLPAAG